MRIAFESFELDLVACELRRDGRAIAMQPRVFDTLRYLVEHRDRIVSQHELLEALWDGQQLNAATVAWSISHARKALEQQAGESPFIRTFPRRGYRFVAAVRSVSGEREPVSARSTTSASPTPFVGRHWHLEQLSAALSEAGAGRGGLVLMLGEAGIGKTRCAAELETIARHRGITAWTGRCMDHGAAPACWPFIQVLRVACGDATLGPRARNDMRELLQELAPAGPEPQAPLSETARFWFLDRIVRALLSSARGAPRLIVLDDLHCADESSLRALAMLRPALHEASMLVLATTREFGGPSVRNEAAALVARLQPGQTFTLGALTLEDVSCYLQTALGHPPADELTAAVHARTGGNPLFVREAVRTALERRGGEGPLRAQDVPLPSAAREFVSQRLAPLCEQTRDVLAAASVIGNDFAMPLLQRACVALDGPQLLSALNDAATARVIEPSGPLSYRFTHPLLRELTYGALSVPRRAQLHAQVGQAFEASEPVDPNVPQLAFHFHHALGSEYAERAVRYARLAGDAAMRVYAYEEAAEYYAWALQAYAALECTEHTALGRLLLKHAASLLRAGETEHARARCEQAMALARKAQLPEILVEAARVLRPSTTGAQVPDPVALDALEEALRCLPDSATAARARTYSQLACIPPYAYRIEESKRLSDEGLRLARASGDRGLELEVLGAQLYTLSGPDTPDELLALADQLLDAERGPASWLVADAHIARYFTLLSMGRVQAAESALGAFGREAETLRVREWAWHQQRFLAHRLLDAGAIDEAQQRFEQLWAEGRALRLRCAPAVYSAQSIAIDAIRSGRGSALDPLGDEQWRWARAIPLYRAWRVVRGLVQGERLQARREFDALMQDDCAAVTRDYAFLGTLAKLTQAAVAFADRDAAHTLQAVLTPYADRIAITDFAISLGSVSHHLGVLARFLGDHAQAIAHFETAQRVNTATGHELLALRSQLERAELLLEAASSKHARGRVRTLGIEVRNAAHRCGAGGLQRSAERLLEHVSNSP